MESFRCSFFSVSTCDAPESDIRVKSYDHLNFSRASIVQFRASRYLMRLNLTSALKVMTIWISRELSLFNFECLDILCAWIWPPCEKLWPFAFLESFLCSISSISIYYAPESDLRVKIYDHLNCYNFPFSIWSAWIYYRTQLYIRVKSYCLLNLTRASVFNLEHLYILWDSIRHPSKKLLSFEFGTSFRFQFGASQYITGLCRTFE